MSLGLKRPKYSQYLGIESSLDIRNYDNKTFPLQYITSYKNYKWANTKKTSFCVNNLSFNLYSKGHQIAGHSCLRNKPEGTYLVIFKPVFSIKNLCH